jgi:hypothetical protein
LNGENWRKSTYSGGSGGSCVEVGAMPGHVAGRVLVRDTTDRAGAVLAVPTGEWRSLLAEVRASQPSRRD